MEKTKLTRTKKSMRVGKTKDEKEHSRKKDRTTKNYLLEIVVFICGAAVMIFELAGSRVLGPYLGASIFVWASLIGVILGSLSIGYWLGGKIADKKPKLETLSLIIFISAILIGLTAILKDGMLRLLQKLITDIKCGSIVASLILFALPSVLLGMVSPYAVMLKMKNLSTSGRTVGNLYAISTLGSIVGTFSAGFFLIPYLGNTKILFMLSITLILFSLIMFSKKLFIIKLGFIIVIVYFTFSHKQSRFLDIDTQYNRVLIGNTTDEKMGKKIKIMTINTQGSSAMFLNDDELVYDYTKFYRLAKHFKPDFKKSLMIGGAAYSYPKNYLKNYPDATIDVVEIDPELTKLAKKYFRLKDNPRLTTFHEDGRTFLNRTQNKYDIVMGDVFKSIYSVPYQLTTQEAVQRIYEILTDDGVVILNICASIEGKKGVFLRAEYATYKSIFPQVYLFPVSKQNDGYEFQNIIVVALKSKKIPDFISNDPELNGYLQHLWKNEVKCDIPELTDDHAPVDYYLSKAL